MRNPFTSILGWMAAVLAIITVFLIASAATVLARVADGGIGAEASSDVLYAAAGWTAAAAFLTLLAWLVARAATWKSSP
jgi:hypothetical protein